MKKIVSILCLVCLLASLCLFVGCSCTSCQTDVPPDHQLASVPAVDGYTLYIPEEWQFVRSNGVITAHVSTVNTTAFTATRVSTTETDMTKYWQQNETELKSLLTHPSDPKDPNSDSVLTYQLERNGETTLVDGHLAYIYEYTGTFPTKLVTYRVLQYFILVGETPADGMIILTMTASDEVKETTGDKDFNDLMREKFARILDVFVVGQQTESEAGTDLSVPDENAPAGMKNATLNQYIGMTVYVPETWQVPVSDGFIGVLSPDGKANIGITNLSVAGGVGVQNSFAARMAYYGITQYVPGSSYSLMDYWNLSKAEFRAYFDQGSFEIISEPEVIDGTDEDGNRTYTTNPPPTTKGETTFYEYRFRGQLNGQTYEVSLYVFRATVDRRNQFRTMFLMTHDADHSEYTAVAEQILSEVRY